MGIRDDMPFAPLQFFLAIHAVAFTSHAGSLHALTVDQPHAGRSALFLFPACITQIFMYVLERAVFLPT
jgi:hypothetical protein